MIISISRRCDIPRFQFDWFMERLDAGFVEVQNPFNAAQIRRVSLIPASSGVVNAAEAAEAMIFWTRDPKNILVHVEALESRGLPFYVMVSVTGYPAVLEPNVPQAETVCAVMRELARKIGGQRVIWRYDPIFFSNITDEDFHRRNFHTLAQSLAGSVQRVIISLYDEYRGAKRRIGTLEKTGVLRATAFNSGTAVEGAGRTLSSGIETLLADIAQTAYSTGMEIQSCAEAENLEHFGIKAGVCIDGELIRKLWGIKTRDKDKNQRPRCFCAQSVDIGRYGDCTANCVYCYAR